jgi:hypothetical protein
LYNYHHYTCTEKDNTNTMDDQPPNSGDEDSRTDHPRDKGKERDKPKGSLRKEECEGCSRESNENVHCQVKPHLAME